MDRYSVSAHDNDGPSLCTDLYQLTMAAAYYASPNQISNSQGIFEMFVRKLPLNRSYIVAAGLEQALQFILGLGFTNKQISYIRSFDVFKNVEENFYEYLKTFKFRGTVWAVPEGTILFPNEPLLRVEAPIIEAQIIETYILSIINFQSLIATKASRIVSAARGKSVIEFGSRRAHGPQAGFLAARASFIGGCAGTSNVLAGLELGIPVFGTMAHSFIMSFEKEEEAFQQFNRVFPSGFLLVDTYDSIRAVKKIIQAGIHTNGIRLDSGDLFSLSVDIRRMLNLAGYNSTKIMASGDLNEYRINELMNKGAPIDLFAVGTELVTSRDDPAMNGVYKLVAMRVPQSSSSHSLVAPNNRTKVNNCNDENKKGQLIYKIKTSPGKKTYPGPKQIHRVLENNLIKIDLVTLEDEVMNNNINSIPLLRKYIEHGKILEEKPLIQSIRGFHLQQLSTLPPKFKNLEYVPETFPVEFSKKLITLLNETSLKREYKNNI
ncbi:MAG TPA: nicotinate phosphoribosyltransferase [Nitrososphaeraceae archaeon]|nr:nicotinate phosphoribosyltransferase [Nitrososphaeraceae archaeon]